MLVSSHATITILCSLAVLVGITIRLILILPASRGPPPRRKHGLPTELMVVLGSGGHTAEMLYMLEDVDLTKFTRRSYIISSGDSLSTIKVKEFEDKKERDMTQFSSRAANAGQLSTLNGNETSYTIAEGSKGFAVHIVPRARLIHQSLWTSPFSAFRCLFACFQLLIRKSYIQRKYPDLILTNGPGTAVMVVGAVLLLRFLDFRGANKPNTMRIIYVESWARIRTLSLTGRLLLPLVDRFIVQWKTLEARGSKCEYHGALVLGSCHYNRRPKIKR